MLIGKKRFRTRRRRMVFHSCSHSGTHWKLYRIEQENLFEFNTTFLFLTCNTNGEYVSIQKKSYVSHSCNIWFLLIDFSDRTSLGKSFTGQLVRRLNLHSVGMFFIVSLVLFLNDGRRVKIYCPWLWYCITASAQYTRKYIYIGSIKPLSGNHVHPIFSPTHAPQTH